jgi:peptidoglycan hydrolase-like protein with peptidoglycan-binding domain
MGWSTDVVIYPGGRDAAAAMPAVATAQVIPPRPAAVPRERPHPELVRELQREMKRVGCYQGDVDGDWGPASRRAMRAFMNHVSSTIQSESPDLIQLTLVRGYRGSACRTLPASGQMMAVQAPAPVPMARRTAVPVYTAATPSALPAATVQGGLIAPPVPVVAARPPVLEGRMSVGAPMPTTALLNTTPSLAGSPVLVPSPRVARPRAQSKPRQQTRRAQRNWTRNFFDQ